MLYNYRGHGGDTEDTGRLSLVVSRQSSVVSRQSSVVSHQSSVVGPRSSLFCLLTSVFCLLSTHSLAGFDYNANCRKAMQEVLNLRFEDARALTALEAGINPDNGYVVYLEHYADAVELIVTEKEDIYDRLIDRYEDQVDRLEKLDDGSPVSRWLQAEILFHTGLAQVKFGTRVSGVAKMLSSYRKIKDLREEYPAFWQGRKLAGIYNIIFDYVPPFMRWATEMFGLAGNSEEGLNQLRQYCEEAKGTPGLSEEAVLITSLGYKLCWKEDEGFDFLQNQDESMKQCVLVKYLFASSATYTYRNDLALNMLAEIHQGNLQVSFYSLYYMTGRCKLNHLEPDAPFFLQKYLDEYPGKDYKKDICNRLSYFYLINNDKDKYLEYRNMISEVGQDLRDRDQEAVIESRSAIEPHSGLLRARLLCDGGYFADAMIIMNGINPDELIEPAYRIEYHYRLGRILQLEGKTDEAVNQLSLAYNAGKPFPYTFATRSALQLGKIFEEKGDKNSAVLWYERCIDTYSSSHTTEGVKDMASKALKRLN